MSGIGFCAWPQERSASRFSDMAVHRGLKFCGGCCEGVDFRRENRRVQENVNHAAVIQTAGIEMISLPACWTGLARLGLNLRDKACGPVWHCVITGP